MSVGTSPTDPGSVSMHPTRRLARKAKRAALAMAAALTLAITMVVLLPGSPHASAGTPPNLLDDNRGSFAGFNLVNSLAPLFDGPPLNLSAPEPFGISLPPGPLLTQDDQGSRVLANPEIVNLYYDGNWDADNPYAPTTEQIDQWTQDLVGSSYLDAAGQYGVGAASFKGSDQANGGSGTFCGTPASSGDVSLVTITGWVSCEAGFGRIITQGDPLTGVPGPNKNTLYVVYIPPTRNVAESGDCSNFSGLHFFSAAYATIFRFPEGFLPVDQNYPFAVVDANCSLADRTSPPGPDNLVNFADLQTDASHEIVEASTNPFLFDGWINNGALDLSHFNVTTFFSDVQQLFTDGEAADICEQQSNAPPPNTPPTYLQPTAPITLPVSDPSVGNTITVAPYWSNADNRCMPTVATTTSLATSGSPSVFGQQVTLTATVATTPPGATPTGTVEFYDGSSELGSATLKPAGADSQAMLSTSSLAVGDHPAITAVYDGQGAYLPSTSSAVDQFVNQAPTNTSVTGLPNPATWGQSVTFTAVVAPAFPSVSPPVPPSGTISFSVNGTVVATEPVTPGSPTSTEGQASYTTSGLLPGSQAVVASYSGDGNFLSSSDTDLQQVTCTSNATSTSGSVKGTSSGSTCVIGIDVGGSVIIGSGEKVFISNSMIGGAVTADSPSLFGLCGSSVAGTVTVRGATGFVVIGDPNDDGCIGNFINGGVVIQSSNGDAEVWSNSINGSLVLHGVSGIGPFPDDTRAEVADNFVTQTIDCQGNALVPTNDGQVNQASSTVGQCTGL